MAPRRPTGDAGSATRQQPAPGGEGLEDLDESTQDDDTGPTADSLARMLGVPVRVWAELGRAKLPLGHALELPPGTVLELDQAAEAPIELFVNGLCFAHGTLEVTAEGEWAVQIDTLV